MPTRFRLANISNVTGELRRIYTLAHHGKMTWQDASCAARILREVRFCLEGGDLEQRLARLEQQLEATPPKPNGYTARMEMRP